MSLVATVSALALSNLLVGLVAFGAGARVRGRRRYNDGHAAGRRFEAMLHGLPCEVVCSAPHPLRFWRRLDRQGDPGPLLTTSFTPSFRDR